MSSDAGTPSRRHRRRRAAFALAHPRPAHRQRVVVVAADRRAGRFAAARSNPGSAGSDAGNQIGLDARGKLQLAFELGARDLRTLVEQHQALALASGLDGPLEQTRVLDRCPRSAAPAC